ncbi:LamG-like jellyroll fold domain-containing protein [uncultured Psychroserpens sp.]|uniref:LamG-like jellyroll fold domain-containing protein n=1 Tax=uncultured Psychroserpens sp. TaxID=255436 RepID=UPI002626F9B9|nr:LamG-like jellyroll fold domain-containing protein [uncultured Psychroserpens sp.]
MRKFLLTKVLLLVYVFSFGNEHKSIKTLLSKTIYVPQISVTGPDTMTTITNGDTTPDMLDGTLFMDTATGQSNPSFFHIINNGSLDLNISNITITGADASEFSMDGIPPTIVASGAQEGLFILFAPQTEGIKTATITIESDDPSTPSYSFAIQGTAIQGGTGLHFDGIDDYVDFPNGNYIISSNFSLELWIQPQISLTTDHYILDTIDGASGHAILINTTGNLVFTFFTSNGVQTLISNSVLTNQWQHLTITYDGATYKMYFDGNLDATLDSTDAVLDSIDNLKLGDIAQGSGFAYEGIIDELRVWDKAIGICGIQNNRLCELAGNEIDLAAYYDFNNGEANGNNFPMNNILRFNHTISAGAPPDGILMNFALNGTTSNWINATSNMVLGSCSTYPELSVSGAGITITNGDTTPSGIDATDFGLQDINASPADNTYNVSNIGTGDATITDVTITGTNASDFAILTSPVGVNTSGSSSNLIIGFVPSSVGAKTATVTVVSDDCDGSYTFDVRGEAFLSGTGLNFDGTDDRIEVSNDSAFNVNTFTIEAYFKTTSTAGGQAIISKYDATGINGFSLFLNSSGRMRFEYAVSNIEETINSITSGLNDGNWHHIALAFGNGELKYYIDGVLDNEITFNNVPNAPTNTESLFIGYSAFNNVHFNGDLDEVRFWSRTLCLDEISAQKDCELSNSVSGLVAKYSFNQGAVDSDNFSETIASDSSTNNFFGTLYNFDLAGGASNWTDTTANGISETCSVAFPEINVQGDGIDILSGDDTPNTSDNTDAEIVEVGNTKDMTFFVRNTDGTGNLQVSSVTLTGDTNDFTITQNPSGNAILAGQSATLRFTFNPTTSGTKTAIVMVNSNDCDEPAYTFTIQGYGAGQGSGLDFDGTDDIVTIPHDISQNNLNFSVDFWIKTTDGIGGVINKFTPNGDNGWRINLDGGRIEFYYYASGSNYITRLLSPDTYVADDNWHHVAVTLNSGNARCYIDGTLARSTGWDGTATAASTTADIQIGYAATDTPTGDSGGYFDGQLDELRFWTKTLTAFEVENLNGCSADMAQNDLLLSYNFNQGIATLNNSTVTTLTDNSGNNTNGTLANFALNGSASNWIDASDNNVSQACDCVVAGGVTLTTQAEVDTYTTALGTCGVIEGNVIINGTITDLSGFSNIHTISGDLYLEGDIVDDLSGFSSLTTIGDDFTLKNMINTTSIASFSNITSLGGGFEVNNLDALTDISILDQLNSIDSITITGNTLLNTISFNQLQTLTGNFVINFSSLSSVSLPQLTQVSGEVRMNNIGSGLSSIAFPLLQNCGNFIITDLTGITTINAPELLSSSGRVLIGGCANLTAINLPNLTSIDNDFSIDNCPLVNTITVTVLDTIGTDAEFDTIAMINLDFLQSVTSIGNRLSLTDLTQLTSIQGMDNLTSLGGFNLTNCDSVTNLEGFPNLNITSLGSLNISGNEEITSLSNSFLESLTTLVSLGISFNGNLIEIDALQNLTALTGSSFSTIRNNNALESMNLFALNNVTDTFIIQNQPNITSLCGLYNYMTAGNGATTLSFTGINATEWDSVQDILDNCNTGLNAKTYLQGAALNPNTGEESLMRDDLRVNDIIPTTSPYSDGMTCSELLFVKEGADAIVDWIWLELRASSDNTTIIASRSALLQRDGDIVHVDGNSPVYFNATVAGNYYVTVKHRNHLGVMTASTVALSNTATAVNYTDANNEITFGTNAQTIFGMPNGVTALWAGDVDGDGRTQYSGTTPDSPSILSTVLNDPGNFLNFPTYIVPGYSVYDVNMDGNTQYSGVTPDTPFVLQNVLAHPSNFLNFSTYAIEEQLPEN